MPQISDISPHQTENDKFIALQNRIDDLESNVGYILFENDLLKRILIDSAKGINIPTMWWDYIDRQHIEIDLNLIEE